MKKSILLFSILIWVAFVSTANDRRGIIIDSDCGADDLRAISLIFASDQYDILAITTSDGVLSPEAGLKKVRSLLCTLNHQGIATAAGRTTVSDPCECRKLNENILGGKECDDYFDYSLNAAQLIQKILSDHRDVLFFAFGSLTNLHDALELYPKGAECISGILWYNRSITKTEGFNFISDSVSAKIILGYHLPITAVSSNPQNPVIFNETMLDTYRHYKTQYSANVYAALSTVAMKEVILKGHFQIWDELLSVYLANPQLFDTLQTLGKIRSVRLKSNVSQDIIVTSIKEFFSSSYA